MKAPQMGKMRTIQARKPGIISQRRYLLELLFILVMENYAVLWANYCMDLLYQEEECFWDKIERMSNVDKAIKKTIVYIKKYGGSLSVEELYDRLIGSTVFSKNSVKGVAIRIGIKIKRENKPLEKGKKAVAKKVATAIAENDNNIIFLGLTGSVAAGNCKKNDDIDLMIVTRKNCLWKSRWRLKLFLKKNGIVARKYGVAEKKNAFCFNMWLDEGELKLPKEKQTLKSAVDLVLMKVLFDRGGVYKKFIRINGWAKKWVATPYSRKLKSEKVLEIEGPQLDSQKASNGVEIDKKNNFWGEWGGTVVNWGMFVIQYLYMWPKIENEKVSLGRAFFHRD